MLVKRVPMDKCVSKGSAWIHVQVFSAIRSRSASKVPVPMTHVQVSVVPQVEHASMVRVSMTSVAKKTSHVSKVVSVR